MFSVTYTGMNGLAVVDVEGVPDEIGGDRRAARPRLDRFARAGLDRLLDLLEQVVVDEEAFLDGAGHGAGRKGLLFAARRPAVARTRMKLLEIRVRRRVGKPLASWPHGRDGWRPPPPFDLPWPPPFGWSTGFIATPRTRGRRPSQRLRPALPSGRWPGRRYRRRRWSRGTWRSPAGSRRRASSAGRCRARRPPARCSPRPTGPSGRPARPQLDGVHHGAGRDAAQRQRVARLDVRPGTALHPVALS